MPKLPPKAAAPDPGFPPDEAYQTDGSASADPDNGVGVVEPAAAPVKKAAKKAAPAKAAAKKVAVPTAPVPPAQPAVQPTGTTGEFGDILGTARNLDEVTDFLSVGYYGREGTAKTTNLAHFVNIVKRDDAPVIFINAESGLKRKALESHGLDTSRILVLPDLERGQELSYDFLEELYWQAKDALVKDPGSIGAFCFDSLTEINVALLSDQVISEVAKAARLGRDRDRWHKEQGDYGKVNDQITLLLRRFRDLPCHFGYAALERRDVDSGGDGRVTYNPAISPGLFNAAGGIPDVVCHTFMEEVEDEEQYLGTFRAVGTYTGKDRYRAVPRRLVNPTVSRIWAYIQGDLTEETDPDQVAAKASRRAAKAASLEEPREGD
jgi:hypothetical protein